MLWAKATLESAGRRSVVGSVHVWCDDRIRQADRDRPGHVRPSAVSAARPRFHLAMPVHDLAAARQFYGEVLGCPEGRSAPTWVDFDLYGHQFVAHLDDRLDAGAVDQLKNAVDGHDVPVPHFGVLLGASRTGRRSPPG